MTNSFNKSSPIHLICTNWLLNVNKLSTCTLLLVKFSLNTYTYIFFKIILIFHDFFGIKCANVIKTRLQQERLTNQNSLF